MYSIEIRDLKKSYKVLKKTPGLKGSFKNFFKREYDYINAVEKVKFNVKHGEILGVIGPNGAGKTTMLKMLSGLLHPTSGDYKVLDHIPWKRNNDFLSRISLVMGNRNQLWWDIPAYDSFLLNCDIYNIPKKEFKKRVDYLSEMLKIGSKLHTPVRNLSLGERMKLEIIAALLHNPEVIFFDEPTIGLDIGSQHSLRDFILEYNKEYKSTILITSHYMQDITYLCKRIIIINKGSLIYDGDLKKLGNLIKQNYKLVKIHFNQVDDSFVKKYTEFLIRRNENELEFQVPNTAVPAFVNEINNLQVSDFIVESPPIENIIQEIYDKGQVNEQQSG